MNKDDIKKFLDSFSSRKERTIVIVDYGNVEKWKNSLGWDVGVRELATLIRHLSLGNKSLRRFYYGSDYGQNEKSIVLDPWSKGVLQTADYNRFEVVTKRVKYIHDKNNTYGFSKKCDLDVEMTVDLIKCAMPMIALYYFPVMATLCIQFSICRMNIKSLVTCLARETMLAGKFLMGRLAGMLQMFYSRKILNIV